MRGSLAAVILLLAGLALPARGASLRYYPLPDGAGPHDVAPAPDGAVWYTAQAAGALGRLDPQSGQAEQIPLGKGSAPHGVIVGPDGAPWITDGGLNAILRVDPQTRQIRRWPLPREAGQANLNTAVFDKAGMLWFTGQAGLYGRLDPNSGALRVWNAPGGRGPYGITVTPSGDIYYASLAGSHIARIDPESGAATVIEPPPELRGARRVWSDSRGRVWVSGWNSGQVTVYDPAAGSWQGWKLPGPQPQVYAVFVDDRDKVWLSDVANNALVRFDPLTGQFTPFVSDQDGAYVRQILGRPGEVWAAESGAGRLVVIRGDD
ncbi:MAG TPA: hypothetical protein VF194_11870 [Ferrovibrio sp.]|uniref:Vgb family protein n=1 Tax=Ferrovibrio sp. TaxID=1917215 RepID=UPI002ED65777